MKKKFFFFFFIALCTISYSQSDSTSNILDTTNSADSFFPKNKIEFSTSRYSSYTEYSNGSTGPSSLSVLYSFSINNGPFTLVSKRAKNLLPYYKSCDQAMVELKKYLNYCKANKQSSLKKVLSAVAIFPGIGLGVYCTDLGEYFPPQGTIKTMGFSIGSLMVISGVIGLYYFDYQEDKYISLSEKSLRYSGQLYNNCH